MEYGRIYEEKSKCCGCGLCSMICPQNVITMEMDRNGCHYPVISRKGCTGCGLCRKLCAYQSEERKCLEPVKAFAAAAKDSHILKKSSSGGIFGVLAASVLKKGGIVCGCAYEKNLKPKHICIRQEEELFRLQGSKYVQSSLGNVFEDIKNYLLQGQWVLFSGTPCQADALNRYLGTCDTGKLLTVDLVCHGVPGSGMFQDFIEAEETKYGIKVEGCDFRDKRYGGWSSCGCITYRKGGRLKYRRFHSTTHSYYGLFHDNMIFRESCYSCRYAGKARPGDITVCDFWGIEKFHEREVRKLGIKERHGISGVLCNTEKGWQSFMECKEQLIAFETELELIAAYNHNLRKPSDMREEREEIMRCYREEGYAQMSKKYFRMIGKKRYLYVIKSLLPFWLKRNIKKAGCKV